MAGSFHWLASYSAINDVSWEVNESGDQEQVATAWGEWLKDEKTCFHEMILVSSCSPYVVPFILFAPAAKIITRNAHTWSDTSLRFVAYADIKQSGSVICEELAKIWNDLSLHDMKDKQFSAVCFLLAVSYILP
jgi:hypothetical protein